MCKIRFAFFCTERCNGRWNWGAKVTAAIDKIPVACVQACVTCVPLSHVYYKHVLHVYKHALHAYHCRTCTTSMCYMCTSMWACVICVPLTRVLQACVTCVWPLHVYKHVTCATSMCEIKFAVILHRALWTLWMSCRRWRTRLIFRSSLKSVSSCVLVLFRSRGPTCG